MKLYIKATTDKYELPLVVEDSPTKLAQKLGLSRHSVATMCSKQINGYHRVEVKPDMYPDNDGGLWYYDNDGRVVYV
jgi:ligand-binding sensor domain-containing protein